MKLTTQRLPMEAIAELIALQLTEGGRARLTVTGCSMLPLLRERRDYVELIPIAPCQKEGQIILYRRENGRYVLHRIISVTDTGYLCCGDNQAQLEPVEHRQLLAVVDSFTRNGKRYTTEHMGYRLYRAACVKGYPLRKYYIGLRRRLGKLYRRRKNK